MCYGGSDGCQQFQLCLQTASLFSERPDTRAAPALSSLPKVDLETVPMLVHLKTERPRPRKVECRPLPFSTPLQDEQSIDQIHSCVCEQTVEKGEDLVVAIPPDGKPFDNKVQCLGPAPCYTAVIMIIIVVVVVVVVVVVELKGAIRDVLQSPHCAANCLQHVRSSGPGAVVCKSRATQRTLITCIMSCATCCEGTAQLLSLTELNSHLFEPYLNG